jgi:hypothetical protein
VPEADYFWFGGGAPEKSAPSGGGASVCADIFLLGGGGRRASANRLNEQLWSLISKYFYPKKSMRLHYNGLLLEIHWFLRDALIWANCRARCRVDCFMLVLSSTSVS